jgi:hypothetical protein
MYSGGHAYFDSILHHFGQQASFFCIESANWRIRARVVRCLIMSRAAHVGAADRRTRRLAPQPGNNLAPQPAFQLLDALAYSRIRGSAVVDRD